MLLTDLARADMHLALVSDTLITFRLPHSKQTYKTASDAIRAQFGLLLALQSMLRRMAEEGQR